MYQQEKFQCPYCGVYMLVETSDNKSTDKRRNTFSLVRDEFKLDVTSVLCLNPLCRKLVLSADLRHVPSLGDRKFISLTHQWQLLPESNAKPFPDYIPEAILKDYTEACRIKDLSPNASATLARRCLQGMIRDFHKVEENFLKKEFEEIKGKVSPAVWRAIEAVRQFGAIGAHMEKDVNVMVDVGFEEAGKLIWLIEFLLKQWYVDQHETEKELQQIGALSEKKKQQVAEAKNALQNNGESNE